MNDVDAHRGGATALNEHESLAHEILAILTANAPLHVIEIADTADRHPITVDRTCARLHDRGQIHPIGRGVYDVTDRGRRQLEDVSE